MEMKTEALKRYGINEDFILKFREEGILSLYPPQARALKAGLFKGRSLVVSCPTASGKTLIATLAIINTLRKGLGKVVYIVPLVAIANEKYSYYRELLKPNKVAISVGELDSTDPWLVGYDLIVATGEKLDSLIRHGAGWIKDLALIVTDEVHLINDSDRGPTLEILLTQLRRICPKAQLLALSATISNAEELARWLKAETVVDEFRPVRLYEGICFDSRIEFLGKDGYQLDDLDSILGIVKNTLTLEKQALFFVATRRSCESLAERLSGLIRDYLRPAHLDQLRLLSQNALSSLEVPTRQCRRLSLCLKGGIAFHHAGLVGRQKRLIEDNFRSGLIKFIVATPTLAMGVNLPAFRVIVRDAKRYYQGRGSEFIPILEYKQFCGRAGRPQYDDFGESILLAKSEDEAQELIQHYIKGRPERIESKLFSESSLRMHSLSLIASEFVSSKGSLFKFLKETFFGFQYQEVRYLEDKIDTVLEHLLEWDFLQLQGTKFMATCLGRRVSQLYIDPMNARYFIESIKRIPFVEDFGNFSLLHIISNNSEMAPLPNIRPKESWQINEQVSKREGQFLQSLPSRWEEEYDEFLKSVKLALIFESWSDEATEDRILEDFAMSPGELHNKLQIADWLLFCLQELCRILKENWIIKDIRRLRVRMAYGVKEELLNLVALRDIGRIRSRKLFDAGIRDTSILKKTPKKTLTSLLGPKVAEKVLEQLGGASMIC
ncbi:DEAD/DEAH box helicase [candidate division NPL-UPA2 bacterium]|nr:DEAD/DEAH box helicase [candidate division NPL-UPA2 bacterium]